jgi:LacI family transcriptional regulator
MSLSKETLKATIIHISEVIDQGMPVYVWQISNEILCDKVIIDDKLAAYEAVKALSTSRQKKNLVTTVDYVR